MNKAILLFALIGLIVLSGCTSKEPVTAGSDGFTETPEVEAEVTTIAIGWGGGKNWDADAEDDGIEFRFEPKDSKDDIVKASGALTVKIYESNFESTFSFEKVRGDLIQQWDKIPISKYDFDSYSRLLVRLPYPANFDQKEYDRVWMEITFKTPNGEYHAINESFYIQ